MGRSNILKSVKGKEGEGRRESIVIVVVIVIVIEAGVCDETNGSLMTQEKGASLRRSLRADLNVWRVKRKTVLLT